MIRRRRTLVLAAAVSSIEAFEPRRVLSATAPAFADKIGLVGVVSAETSFEDNFDGTAIDKSKWQVRDGHRWRAYKDAPVSTFSYTDESPILVAGGELQLIAHNDPATGQLKGAFLQTGRQFNDLAPNSPVPAAKLTPGYTGDFEQTFGYWETRAKFSSLPGMWSAFWVHSYRMSEIREDASKAGQPETFGTEYDVVEHSAVRNTNNPTPHDVTIIAHASGYGSHHVSSGSYPATVNYGPSKTPPGEYHVYGMLWTDKSVKFYIDGNLVHTLTDPKMISQVPQMALLSVEVGAGNSREDGKGSNFFGYTPAGGYGSKETSQARATFDYVRVWRLAGVPAPVEGTPASAAGQVFVDANQDGIFNAGDAGRAGVTVFADYDGDGVRNAGEPSTVTDASGNYRLEGMTPRTGVHLTIVKPDGATPVNPSAGRWTYYTQPGKHDARRDFAIAFGPPTTTPTTPLPPPTTSTAGIASAAFVDANDNGTRDAGEGGLAGAIVYVDANYNGRRDADELWTTTAADGAFRIDNLPLNKSVQVLAIAPTGYAQSAPRTGGYAFRTYANMLNTKVAFGFKPLAGTTPPTTPPPTTPPTDPPPTTPTDPTPPPAGPTTSASLSSVVFVDLNGDGVRNAGEVGLADVVVFVDANYNGKLDADERWAKSSADGSYRIDNLPINKSVQALALTPAGYARSAPTSGGFSFKTYEGMFNTRAAFGFKPLEGTPPPPVVPTEPTTPTGPTPPPPTPPTNPTTSATVASVAFVDANNNGVRDAGEVGLAGVVVYVDANYNGRRDADELWTTTAADGSYRIDGLPINKSVQVLISLPAGYRQSTPLVAGYAFRTYESMFNSKATFGAVLI